MGCGCGDCEQMMQPYMDKVLSDEQMREAEEHLEACPPCGRRYRFEESLRQYVRVSVDEPISAELQAKLAGLRSAG
jgi:Putative zinc-finger